MGGSRVSLTSAGTIDGALAVPAVYRSVNKVAGIVAQMPWESRRGRQVVDPRPALLRSPSPGILRPSAWKRTAATSMLLGGGVSALVDDVRPTRVDLLHPDLVDWDERRGWTVNGEQIDEWPLGPLWHVPLMTLPGSPKGVNPLEYARRTTFPALAAKEFGGNFFRDGAHPTTVIAPESDPGEVGAKRLKKKITDAVSGTNREPIVVPQSVKWHQIQINPEDSQFIELMKFTGGELAGFFGLKPEDIGLPVEGSSVQYSNRENRQQDVLQDAVMPVLVPLEEALTELLQQSQTVKFNTAGVLRADLKARYESYAIAARIKQSTGETFLGVDEMRELEDRGPYEGDDGSTSDARQLSVAEVIQKVYLGVVNGVITAEEARLIINAAGGDLAIPGPFTQGDDE